MISSIRGTVQAIVSDSAIIEAAGVGYQVFLTPETLNQLRLEQQVLVHTTFIVREDAQLLFGFTNADDRALFDTLRSVNGVGPKTAMAILAGLTREQIFQAVANEDDRPFRSITGIGPKTAKLIVVSLAGRVSQPLASQAEASEVSEQVSTAVTTALLGLGWNEAKAREAIEATATSTITVGQLLRDALEYLGGGRA